MWVPFLSHSSYVRYRGIGVIYHNNSIYTAVMVHILSIVSVLAYLAVLLSCQYSPTEAAIAPWRTVSNRNTISTPTRLATISTTRCRHGPSQRTARNTILVRGGDRGEDIVEDHKFWSLVNSRTMPHFQVRFGRGFAPLFSSDSDSNSDMDSTIKDSRQTRKVAEKQSRHDTISTITHNKDSLQIYQIGRVCGIALGLPIYLTIRFLQLGWVVPSLYLIDVLLARPLGICCDAFIFLYTVTSWSIFTYALIPIAKLIWIPLGMCLWSVCVLVEYINKYIFYPFLSVLVLTYAGLLRYAVKMIEVLNVIIFGPLIRLAVLTAMTLLEKLQSMKKYITSVILTYVITPFLSYILIPFWVGSCTGYRSMTNITDSYVIKPLLRYVLKPIWQVSHWIITFLIWKCIAQPIIHILGAIGVYGIGAGMAVYHGILWFLNSLYANAINPIGRTVVAPFVYIYHVALPPLVRAVKAILIVIMKVANSVLTAIQRKWFDLNRKIGVLLVRVRVFIFLQGLKRDMQDMVKNSVSFFTKQKDKTLAVVDDNALSKQI